MPRSPSPRGSPQTQATEEDPESAARSLCLRQLALGPRTRSQLEVVLGRHAIPTEASVRVLDRLAAVGLVDDEAFAEGWVRSRHAARGLARRGIGQELRSRGVDEETASRALATLSPEQERETAQRLAARALARSQGLPLAARVRRASGVLARRGYPGALAAAAVRAALDAEGADSEVDASLVDELGSGVEDHAIAGDAAR